MLTAKEFAFATPADLGGRVFYRRFCRAANLAPVPDGYGMLFVVDEAGARLTLLTADVEYVRMFLAAPQAVVDRLELTGEAAAKFLCRDGWPDDWA